MLHLIFVTNFSMARLFLMACVYSIGAMETPGSFFGGIAFFAPAAAIARAEWIAWYRKRFDVLRPLAVCYLVFSALAMFGIISNVAAAVYVGWSLEGIGWFIAIGLLIAIYLGGCGIYCLRVTKASTQRPHPNDDAPTTPP